MSTFSLWLTHASHSGLDNGGKTTIVKRLLGKDISTISPTLGFSIESVYIKGLAYHPAENEPTDRKKATLSISV
jgi:hypothetical protein